MPESATREDYKGHARRRTRFFSASPSKRGKINRLCIERSPRLRVFKEQKTMQYLLMIHGDEKAMHAAPQDPGHRDARGLWCNYARRYPTPA